jgi:outer membrane protein assembly factor BamB
MDGTSTAVLPVTWSQEQNIRWKAAIPGKGHSSPIVSKDRIFVTTCIEEEGKRMLLCLARKDGRELWRRVVFQGPLEEKHRLNSYASSTPATDGRFVWVTFLAPPRVLVVCYDLEGQEIWRVSPGEFYSKHGFCSSPVLYEDLVIINGDQDAEAWIVALEQKTGKERWRADRPNRTRSYCVPIIVDAAGRKQLVLSGSKCVASYDPDTGEQIWIIDGPTEQFVASLVYTQGLLFLTGGYPEYHMLAIRPDGRGNVTETHVVWHERNGASYVPSPIADAERFYLVNDNGVANCFEARTGKRLWTHRLGRRHSASPISAGGLLYFPDDDGKTHVVKASDRFERVAVNDLGEEIYASPAVAGDCLLLRTVHHLYCIGQPSGASQR